jgi:hypothetical protein
MLGHKIFRGLMTTEQKGIEKEVIVTAITSKENSVTLDLRFADLRFREPTQQQLENIIEPLPKSPMEQAGRDVAKGYMEILQKQLQQGVSSLQTMMAPTLPPDTIRIFLSKQEYFNIGKPTVYDTLILTLKKQ